MTRLLENRKAVIYGAGGAIGGAVAQAFAGEGAQVFLTGRSWRRSNGWRRRSSGPVAQRV
jgi:3-oxoacyl-[acyl-carrier protein] reductase